MIREVPSEQWDEYLLGRGLVDIYLRQGYLAASCLLDPGEPKLLSYEAPGGGVVLPLILRAIPSTDLRDAVSPYGYGGPVGFGYEPPWDAFHQAYDEWCTAYQVVTSFFRFHPLYGNHVHSSASMRSERLAGTVGWRIVSGRDLLAGMHKEHRRTIRIAQSAGLRAIQLPIDRSNVSRFRALYEKTMARVDANEYYMFHDQYWDFLSDQLSPQVLLLEAITREGALAAAALCFVTPPWMHYHLGASADFGRPLGATTWLLWMAGCLGQDQGIEVFHLGGGRGGDEDSLLRFKLRFDPVGRLDAAIGKQVHDPGRYLELSGSSSTDGFFPRYRAPTADV